MVGNVSDLHARGLCKGGAGPSRTGLGASKTHGGGIDKRNVLTGANRRDDEVLEWDNRDNYYSTVALGLCGSVVSR